ncbi:MAG: CBS domain-containing protein [Candidatus Krumholzibacteriia bacterium]
MKADPIVVKLDAHFAEIARLFIRNNITYLYVVDAAGLFKGVVRLQDTKAYLNRPDLADVIIALDLLVETFPRLHPDSTLREAMAEFARHDGERLPVVSREGETLQGSITKADVLLTLAHATATAT